MVSLWIGIVPVAVMLAAVLVCGVSVSRLRKRFGAALEQEKAEKEMLRQTIADRDRQVAVLQERLETAELWKRQADTRFSDMREHYEKTLSDIRQAHQQSLRDQLAALRSEMTARTEEMLRQREEALTRKAQETFSALSGNLGKSMESMKLSFEQNKQAQVSVSASLRADLENAVKNLNEQTRTIGSKADRLADALRGGNKMQGCWGETILNNLLLQEGLVEGRDFDREATLRDETGIVLRNEESGKRMRPDFILHFPDKVDVVVDSKVSLEALSDYFAACDEAARQDAAKRNLQAIRAHVKALSDKAYAQHIRNGRRSLGYVLMFVPNYAALQLARLSDPDIFRKAYADNVLITSEETLMPFLRTIRTAWFNVEQVRNQEKIVKAAQTMIERVADFARIHAELGDRLDKAADAYRRCDRKLREGGQSILTSARQVVGFGIPENPKKPLPSAEDVLPEEISSGEGK